MWSLLHHSINETWSSLAAYSCCTVLLRHCDEIAALVWQCMSSPNTHRKQGPSKVDSRVQLGNFAERVQWLQFAGMTKLKKAAFLVVARCLSSEEISGLRQLFKTIDTDNSGTITVDELKVCTGLVSRALLRHAFLHTTCLLHAHVKQTCLRTVAACLQRHTVWLGNCKVESVEGAHGDFNQSMLVTREQLMHLKAAACSHNRRVGGHSHQYGFKSLMGVSQLLTCPPPPPPVPLAPSPPPFPCVSKCRER